jgi:tetratricopeptide (TPR) repeat protein
MPLSDVSELIKSILEQEDVPVKLCELIYEKTKGNPFFVEEVVKSLKEDDVIFREDNRWKFKDISKIEFPETVRNVLKTRFSRLDDECQNVLTLASFVGNDFTLEAISALTQIDEGRLLELMDRILKTGLIKEREVRGEGVCSFADILVRDVVYEEVSLLKRKKLHGVVGSALEKVYAGKLDEHLGELAYHFLEGGNKEKALDYFMKAGEKSARIFANAEAASNFESALRLLEEKKGVIEEKARVLEILGDKKKLVGEYKSCLDNWNEALLLWKGLDEKKRVAELHRKVAFVLWHEFGNVEKAQENFDMAIKILDTMPESVELATLYSEKARISYFTKDVTEALSWSRRGLEIATRLNAFETIASTYVNMALVFGATGDNVKQSECLKKALEIALHNDYVDVALRAYNNTANMFASEESGRALEYWEKGFELARKVGDIDWISWIGSALSGVYFSMGNTSKALLLAEESETLSRKSGNLNSLHLSLGYLGLIYHVLGEWNKSEQYVKEAFDISQKLGNIQSSFRSYALLGWFHLDRDDYRKAKEYFEKGREITQKAGMLDIELTASQWIASTSAELGEIEKANNLIGKSLNFALEKQNKELLANAHVSKAVVLRIERKWNESIEYFEKGLKEHEALGARRFNVYFFAKLVLIEYARVYLERNQEGDKEKARDLFNQALEIFQKMGAKKDIEKVEASLLYIETGKPTSMLKPTDVVATGYPSLDNLLYGGIPTNYSVILTSPSCDERDLLINSFLETGLNKGEAVFYVTTNASSAKTLAEISSPNLQLFVCNPEAEAIIKDSSNAHMIKGVENLTEISIALASTINRLDPTQKGSRRVCLGIVSDVLLQHHAVETRRWLTALITRLKSEGFTILGIMDPEMHSLQDSCVILDLFDGIVSICERQTEKGVERFLKIKKMRNKKYREDELPLKG